MSFVGSSVFFGVSFGMNSFCSVNNQAGFRLANAYICSVVCFAGNLGVAEESVCYDSVTCCTRKRVISGALYPFYAGAFLKKGPSHIAFSYVLFAFVVYFRNDCVCVCVLLGYALLCKQCTSKNKHCALVCLFFDALRK